MIHIFVEANDHQKSTVIADHYEFISVPRIGEEIVVDEGGKEVMLRVLSVLNFAKPHGDVLHPLSYINLKCELIGNA